MRMAEFVVERSETIAASPQDVFDRVGSLQRWNEWSPWAELDPDMDTTYTGEVGAVGSTYAWKGNRKVGQGKMTLTEIDPPNRVAIDLQFLKPFRARNDVELTVAASGDDAGSEVTWRMTGQNTVMVRLMALFGRSMDKMVGPDFEKGLAKLKRLAET